MSITLPEHSDPHTIGNRDCEEGWCGTQGYPKACDNAVESVLCPGLIHAEFGDESWDSYCLFTKCDICGESE